MKKIIYIIIVFFMIYSCSVKEDKEKEYWNTITIPLKSTIVADNIDIYISRDILLIDSILIIGNGNTPPLYGVYKLNEKNNVNHLFDFGEKGEGPTDFIFNKYLINNNNDLENIGIYDGSLYRYYTLNLKNCEKEKQCRFDSVTYFKETTVFRNVLKMGLDAFIGTGMFGDNMFGLYLKDSLYAIDSPYPEDGVFCSNEQKNMVYQGAIAKKPSSNQFVYVSFYSQILRIYNIPDINKRNVYCIFSDELHYPQYNAIGESDMIQANLKKENTDGFFMVSTTDEYIYALYSGKQRDAERGAYADQLYIYDWSGKRIKKMLLDKDVSAICVDQDNKYIYAIYTNDDETEVSLIRYKIDL